MTAENQPVINLSDVPGESASMGPAVIDKRTPGSGLGELASGLVTFPDGGTTEPWTLPYEETFFVLEGQLTLHVVEGDGSSGPVVVGAAGEFLALQRGVTVRYEGAPGTRAVYSLVPADWASR